MGVIPAKAGIQFVFSRFFRGLGVDSRFRGNDIGMARTVSLQAGRELD
jgi:hypothetical protein